MGNLQPYCRIATSCTSRSEEEKRMVSEICAAAVSWINVIEKGSTIPLSLQPTSEGWEKIVFSVCSHRGGGGGEAGVEGTPPLYHNTSTGPMSLLGGTPTITGRGTPHPWEDGVPKVQERREDEVRPCQVPQSRRGWGSPLSSPPIQERMGFPPVQDRMGYRPPGQVMLGQVTTRFPAWGLSCYYKLT